MIGRVGLRGTFLETHEGSDFSHARLGGRELDDGVEQLEIVVGGEGVAWGHGGGILRWNRFSGV